MSRPPSAADRLDALPPEWRARVRSRLAAGEQVSAWFEPDLDSALRFSSALVAITDRRVLAAERAGPGADAEVRWSEWPLADVRALRSSGQAGLGTLELVGSAGRLAAWRYTAARTASAERFAAGFQERLRAAADPEAPSAPAGTCPECGAAIPADASECPSCRPTAAPSTLRSLLRLWRFARPRLKMIVAGFALTLAGTAAGLVPPYLTMPLLDDVLVPHQAGKPVAVGFVAACLAGLAGAAVLEWLLSWTRTYVLAKVGERISADLRNETFSHLQRLSLDYFGPRRTGDLISRVGSDTDRICTFLSVNLLDFAADVLMITLTSIILLSIDPILAAATLAPFPAIAWLLLRVRGKLKIGFDRAARVWGEMVSVLADAIPGIRVVKAYAQEPREIERFGKANRRVVEANDRVNLTWAFAGPMVTLLTQAGLLVVWGFGAWRVATDQITVGVLTAFLAYIARFYARLESMSRMTAAVQRAAAATNRIFEILDRVPSVPEPVRPVSPGRLKGRIELQGVSFQYGARPILRAVSLAIEPGEMIGLVGRSGAGKTTLVNLICRFFDAGEGRILADGTDIRSFPVGEYRRNIALVLQDPFLFYGTVAENIAYGRPDASRSEIMAAARAARAHDFILRLPDGYDSVVGERGQSLSGGERQRISIARALLIDPRILILDEATSSVDTETEREIQAALENLIRGRTTLAIAHRLDTLRRADRLVVLERGRISQIGSHAELLAKGGLYAELWNARNDEASPAAADAAPAPAAAPMGREP